MSEGLPTPAAIQKAGREVQEFRRSQRLTREFLGTNAEICRLRPLEEEAETDLKKKRSKRSGQKITREIEQFLRVVFRDRRNTGDRSGSDRNGHALGSTLGGCRCVEPTAAFPAPSEAGRTLQLLGAL
jgi:hypothetical protein